MVEEKSGWNVTLTSRQQDVLRACLRQPLPDANRIPHIGSDTIYRMICADLELAVKRYRRFSEWKTRIYRKQGTPAERSFRSAVYLSSHHIGTPIPIAFFETWDGYALQTCDYVCVFEADHADFRSLCVAAQQRDADAEHIRLIECVAQAIARMHAVHFLHHDLGSQNIFLPTDPALWSVSSVKFLDLNRGRVMKGLSMIARAKDLARIHLTGELQKGFIAAYQGDQRHPGFLGVVRLYQFRFWLKGRTHRVRHPIRAFKRWFDQSKIA